MSEVLRGASERHDGQVPPAADKQHFELERSCLPCWPSFFRSLWQARETTAGQFQLQDFPSAARICSVI